MSQPRAAFLEDSYRFEWGSEGVEMVLEQFKESSGGLKCELTVTCSRAGQAGVLQSPMLHNLMTNNAQLVKRLSSRVAGVDWDGLITQANGIAVMRYREGSPLVDLAEVDPLAGPRYLLAPYISAHGATVWAADGGTGKSMLGAAAALSVATGIALLGPAPQLSGPVIYVDWEADAVTHGERVTALWRGAGEEGPLPSCAVHYQEETASLPQIAPRLRRRVNETGAVMVVVDSLGQARGGGVNDDEATNAAFKAARTLKVPCLFIDHISKQQREGNVKKRTSIGSVYTRNNARLLWVVEKEQDEG
ncbi:MAG TPA: AAA family ATPase, partial [Gemmatimonadales bacterium]